MFHEFFEEYWLASILPALIAELRQEIARGDDPRPWREVVEEWRRKGVTSWSKP